MIVYATFVLRVCMHRLLHKDQAEHVVEMWIERRYQDGHIVNSQQKLEENRQSVPRA